MTNKRETHRIVVPTGSGWLGNRKGAQVLESLWNDGGEGTLPVSSEPEITEIDLADNLRVKVKVNPGRKESE
jgi:hypothetical protein